MYFEYRTVPQRTRARTWISLAEVNKKHTTGGRRHRRVHTPNAVDRPFCFSPPTHFHWNQLIIIALARTWRFHESYTMTTAISVVEILDLINERVFVCHRLSWWLRIKILYTIVLNGSFCIREAGRGGAGSNGRVKKKVIKITSVIAVERKHWTRETYLLGYPASAETGFYSYSYYYCYQFNYDIFSSTAHERESAGSYAW